MTTLLALTLAVMIVVAAVGLTIPLVRRYDAAAREGETITAVIRGQLDDVDDQVAAGQLGGDTAAALRTELKRRLLVEARARPLAVRLLTDRTAARLALGVGVVVALAATGLYAVGGRPDLAGSGATVAAEVAAATGTAPASDGGVGDMIRQLETRAAQTPDDATGWRTLASAYFAGQRFADAAAAYTKAVRLRPRDAALLSAQGEALTQAAGGVVTPAAASAFAAAHGIDASDPRARYFLALARDQHGDHAAAITDWVALLNDAPADAAWAPELRRFVETAARQANVSLAGRLRAAPVLAGAAPPIMAGAANARGPDAAAVAAAGTMSDAGRAVFIKGMVDSLAAKLAANPRDADGWIRLIRARKVMGDDAASRAALASGRAAFADQPATAKSIADAAATLGVSETSAP